MHEVQAALSPPCFYLRFGPSCRNQIHRSPFKYMPQQHQAASDFELGLARAFDLAWDRFVELEGSSVDTPDNRGRLAARIVVLAKTGETDEKEIAATALIYLRAFAAAVRLAPDHQQPSTMVPVAGVALDPEAIDAVTTALDACVAGLPLGISSTARAILSESILEHAAKGERDPDRLQALALDALKLRR